MTDLCRFVPDILVRFPFALVADAQPQQHRMSDMDKAHSHQDDGCYHDFQQNVGKFLDLRKRTFAGINSDSETVRRCKPTIQPSIYTLTSSDSVDTSSTPLSFTSPSIHFATMRARVPEAARLDLHENQRPDSPPI